MEELYYTPIVEEFHIGFEYEELEYPHDMLSIVQEDNNWENRSWKKRVTDEFTYCIQLRIDQEEFRIKYLDKEDIKSLGFNATKSFDFGFDEFFSHNKSKLRLYINYTNHIVKLQYPHDDFGISFSGKIKNKSELELILKQI